MDSHIRTWVTPWAIPCLAILTLMSLGCSPNEGDRGLPRETVHRNEVVPGLPDETIYQAAASGNLTRVKELVESGVDPALPGWYAQQTPLHLAAESGRIGIVRYLVEHGVPVDPANRKGETPLTLAAWSGHGDVVRYLSGKGAEYPIIEAARVGDVERAREILETNPELLPERHDVWGTPLHIAARHGHARLVDYLLSLGADMNDPIETLGTPFEIAGEWGHVETVKVFLEHGAQPTAGDYALIGDFDGMVSVPAPKLGLPEEERGENPLVMACKSGETKIVRYLLRRGASPMSRGPWGGCALDRAIHHEHPDLIRLLMQYPKQVEAQDLSGYSPLTYAASRGKTAAIAALIELGKDVNAPDRAGRTALEAAVREGYLDTVRFLMDKGADVRAGGKNLLAFAGDPGSREVAELLIAHGAEITSAVLGSWLTGAISRGASGEVANLLKAGADVDAPGPYGRKPLHAAAMFPDPSVVKILLDAGADVDAPGPGGRTPLHSASVSGASKVVEFLLEHGAEINARDRKGFTPLYLACQRDRPECVDILLARGADASLAGSNGWPPIFESIRCKTPDILRSLLAAGVPIDATVGDSTILQHAVSGARPEMVGTLLSHGADATVTTDDGSTLLHLAAHSMWPEDADLSGLVRKIVSLGVDIDARDVLGRTPAVCAIRFGRPAYLGALLANGTDIRGVRMGDMSLLHVAVRYGPNDDSRGEIIDILLAAGADRSAIDSRGMTAFDLAEKQNLSEDLREKLRPPG